MHGATAKGCKTQIDQRFKLQWLVLFLKNNGIQAPNRQTASEPKTVRSKDWRELSADRPVCTFTALRRGPVAPERALQEAVSVSVSLEMADVPAPIERPLPGGGGDAEDAERGVGDVPADAAARWVGVPAELQYRCAVGDHHHPLPCRRRSSEVVQWTQVWCSIRREGGSSEMR